MLAMGLLPIVLPAVSPGAHARRPAAGASRRHLGLRGGSEDVAEQGAGQGALLPARVRASLLAGAEDTYSHETALEPRDGMIQMTMGQRLIFERSFANARQQGVRVPEAQALAIRSAAEGRVIEPDASMVGSTSIMCLACQLEVADRAQIRAHFATDFHAFNLERKRAGVAPLPQQQFEHRAASLLQEEAQRESATAQQETLNDAHRALRQASRRSAKLAADIEKLLSAKNRNEAALEKARMLLDKKAICDKVSVVPHYTNTIRARAAILAEMASRARPDYSHVLRISVVAYILKDRASPLNRCLRSAQEVQEHAARLKSSWPLAPRTESSAPHPDYPASLGASPATNPGGGGLVHAARAGGRKLRGAENALSADGALRARPPTETSKRRAATEVMQIQCLASV
jgi:hypothetical protein